MSRNTTISGLSQLLLLTDLYEIKQTQTKAPA